MRWLQRRRDRKAAEKARKEQERREKERLESRRRFLRRAIGLGIAATGLGVAYKIITTPVEYKKNLGLLSKSQGLLNTKSPCPLF